MEQPKTTRIQCAMHGDFAQWMSQKLGTLAITTYQAGKIVLLGWNGKQVSILPRDFPRPMGLAIKGTNMAICCRHEIMLLANDQYLAAHYPEENASLYERLFLPRSTHLVGNVSAHDIAYGDDGLYWINTRFSCLSRISENYSFEPVWQPWFIDRLEPEDRCHLNGMAIVDGKPKYITAHGDQNTAGGWRDAKATGGVIMDIEANEFVARGFAMPHSPRVYQDKLWVLNSGMGELCIIDPVNGHKQVVCVLPGYVRGLCFVDDYAVIGLSTIRDTSKAFGGLPIQNKFEKLYCGVAIVDLKTGKQVGMFEFTDGCAELYDVQWIADCSRTSIANPRMDAAIEAVSAPEFSYWIKKNLPRNSPQNSPRNSPTKPPTQAPQVSGSAVT